MKNRKFIAAVLVALTLAVCFSVSTQMAYAQSNEKKYSGDYVGTTFAITNTGGDAWIMSAQLRGAFSAATNSVITLSDGLAKTMILAEGSPTNTLNYVDAAEGVFFPGGSIGVVTFFSSAVTVETNSYRLNTVPQRDYR